MKIKTDQLIDIKMNQDNLGSEIHNDVPGLPAITGSDTTSQKFNVELMPTFSKKFGNLFWKSVSLNLQIYDGKLINNSLPARAHLYENHPAKTPKQIPPGLNPVVENRASSG